MKYFKGLMLVLFATAFSSATAQLPTRVEKTINMVDRDTGSIISGVDIGRFQADEDNVVIVPDTAVKDTVVCRFRSAAGNCYRLSVNDGRGSVPVPLIDRSSFNNFLDAFRARPNWEACEIIENPWGGWQPVGAIPTEPGTHTYTEERFCSTGGLFNACPDTCDTATQTRTVTIANEPACVDTTWAPSVSDFYVGSAFVQTSNCGNTRPATGILPVADEPSCVVTSWLPEADSAFVGEAVAQTSNCGTTQYVPGTRVREAQCIDTSWTPPTSDYYEGTGFTQTSNCFNTRAAIGTTAKAIGTASVATEAQCLVTSWSPESDSAFVGETVVQTSNCRTTREVPGTRVREAQCLVTSWLPESNSAFVGETVAQTSNCGTTREVPGTREPPVQCDSRFDLGGLDPADFFTDQCAVFYNKCEQSTTICGLKPDPKPVRCMIIPATFEVVLHFVYVGGSEDFAEYVSGTSTNDLISNANRVINSYTSGGAIELLYSVDNSVSAITVCE